jgi:hypothetical protein
MIFGAVLDADGDQAMTRTTQLGKSLLGTQSSRVLK